MKTIRIGCGSGFANDRIEPAIEQLEKGNLDYLMFECLGERTVAFAMQRKNKDPRHGYDAELENRFKQIFGVYKKQKVTTKIISNMGGANPVSAVEKIVEMANERGIKGLKVAAVVGDDILARIDNYLDYKTMEQGVPLRDMKDTITNANAYIGCTSIVEALKGGADIVITGRAADPSLTVGPCVYEFGWAMDDWDKLACATIAGHLLECGFQVCGGYFADPGYKEDVAEPWKMGYPIAIVSENGDIEITKVEDSGGLVSELTVKEQLIYEIQDPSAYLTPDVVADFTNVEVKQTGKNRVAVTGGRGRPKTGKLKVSCGFQDCFIGEGEFSFGGYNCLERAKLGAETILKRLDLIGIEYSEIRVDYIGYNSLFKDKVSNEMSPCEMPEVRLRIAARTKDRYNADRVGYEMLALGCSGPAGLGGPRSLLREVITIGSILVDESDISTEVIYYGGDEA